MHVTVKQIAKLMWLGFPDHAFAYAPMLAGAVLRLGRRKRFVPRETATQSTAFRLAKYWSVDKPGRVPVPPKQVAEARRNCL